MKPVLLAVVLALAGCGGEHTHGSATLWVTSGRGADVLYTGTVPAGLTAMQALVRVQKVSTRYGGRYVQSIDGRSGSLSSQHDWFFFVNGVESDTGAAEVTLHPGDVEWWDYRSWAGGGLSVPVVIGAFPEPFLHGFQWAKPGATVLFDSPAVAATADRLATDVGGKPKLSSGVVHGNVISIGAGASSIRRVGNAVVLHLALRDATMLARNPAAFRYRYEVTS